MGNATFDRSRHRALIFGALVVLLHSILLSWLIKHPGPGSLALPGRSGDVVVTQLVSVRAEPAPVAAPPPPPPPKVRQRPPPPKRPVAPVPEVPAPEPRDESVQPAPAASSDEPTAEIAVPDADAGGQGGAAPAPGDVQSVATAPPPPAEPAAPVPAQRRYKVNMPPPAALTLAVARTDADGTQWTGEAEIAWKPEGSRYRMNVEVGIRVVFARVNLVVLTSEGAVGAQGFEPVTMTEKRRGRALTATHFNRQDGRITFSASQASVPLVPGTQDKASVPLQLTAIARGDAGQLSGDIDILVGEDKDASVYRFVVLGQEEIDTWMGRMLTWHLSRPPKPGSYNSRLDIWLAPEHEWFPVRIRNTESSGAVTTQTVNKIVMK